MNLFSLGLGPLSAIFILVAVVFIASLLLNRQTQGNDKWISSLAISCALLFSIETYLVTIGLIPPQTYVQGQPNATTSAVLDDWVSSAGVNMGDLIFAWIYTSASIIFAAFLKHNRNQTNSNNENSNQALFYDNFGITGALAVVLTSMLYILVIIPSYFDAKILLLDKILFRGPIPYITVGLFIWVILNVLLLAKQMILQRKLDGQIKTILTDESEQKMAQVEGINEQSILRARLHDIKQAAKIEPLQSSEYTQLVEQQSAIEREKVSVSVLYLHTAMWAIPVLGFLGTVWGIAEAVANLIPLLKGLSASELGGSQLAESLAGLGVAFDTTLVALSLSIPAMALISLIEKVAVEDMLIRDGLIIRHGRHL